MMSLKISEGTQQLHDVDNPRCQSVSGHLLKLFIGFDWIAARGFSTFVLLHSLSRHHNNNGTKLQISISSLLTLPSFVQQRSRLASLRPYNVTNIFVAVVDLKGETTVACIQGLLDLIDDNEIKIYSLRLTLSIDVHYRACRAVPFRLFQP